MKNKSSIYSLIHIIAFLSFIHVSGQDTYQRNSSADVDSYIFNLRLSDKSNSIEGEAEITVDFKKEIDEFALDLVAKSETFGMELTEVLEDSAKVDYSFEGNKIKIIPSTGLSKQRVYKIKYKGIPERGLVNRYHKIRTAFFLWRQLA